MTMCNTKSLKKLLKLVEKKKLFKDNLKPKILLCIQEIFKNICLKGSNCQQCFPKSILKKLKKEKKFIRELLNLQNSLRKTKKIFLSSDRDCQALIYTVLQHFFDNCVEPCEEGI